MRFRLCCTFDDEEKVKTVKNKEENCAPTSELSSNSVPSTTATVVTQQPKNVGQQPIQLDRITEVSVEESSVQTMEDEQQTPIGQNIRPPPPPIQDLPIPTPRRVEPKQDTNFSNNIEDPQIPKTHSTKMNEFFNLLQAERAKEQYIPPVIQPSVNQTSSNISVDTMIGEEKLTFNQIAPDLYHGIFKGSQFYIINGKFQDDYFSFNENDKSSIQAVYDKVIESMQRGIEGLSGGMNALNGQGQEIWNPPPGSTINTNYITRRGEKAVMTFKAIGKGHFRSTYEGKEFTILNGQLRTIDSSFDEEDIKLILQTYKNTLLGMEHGLQSMRQGTLGMRTELQATQIIAIGGSAFAGTTLQGGSGVSSVAVAGNATAYASTGVRGSSSAYASAIGGMASVYAAVDGNYNILATGRETLKRMRSLNHGKRISLLEGGLMAQPRQPVMVIEDITEKSNKPQYFDDVDGEKLTEPVLQKTTFTPQTIIYDDPKTYEEQDSNELPLAKQLDEYIISVDENFNSENRYHFHKARPSRVTRGKLNPKEKFRLASPERYSLFEGECLKLHNQYRKMHGVPPLVHNEFLSQVAKEWAEHLALKDAFYHRPKNEYGENLYYVEGMPCRAKMAVKAWYDEIDLYDYDNPKFSKEVGHFTQLVWKDTREVGTGVAQIGDKVWVCCNYHPPGNYLDKMNDEFVPRPLIKRIKRI